MFEFEKIIFFSKKNYKLDDHIFITGLPRSGTTLLLNLIYKSEEFSSLTYYDMPLIMAPNLFSKFKKKKLSHSIKRYHYDEIQISLSSPESFDEVFFSTFKKESDVIDNYKIFVSLICSKYNKERYISKNNNNFKRIALIKDIFKNSKIFVTFRDPLQQAFSLFNQNINFLNLQSKNKFVLYYMKYLGHNEFGYNHQFWFKPDKFNKNDDINYWLEQWKFFYQDLINKKSIKNNFFLICYENLCDNENSLKLLEQIVGVKIPKVKLENKPKDIKNLVNKDLLDECNLLYEKLKIKSTYDTYNTSMD